MLVTKARLYLSLLLIFIEHLPTTENNLQGHSLRRPMSRKTVRDPTHPLCRVGEASCKREDGKQNRHFLQSKHSTSYKLYLTQNLVDEKRSTLKHLSSKKYVLNDTQASIDKTVQDMPSQISKPCKRKKIFTLDKHKKSAQPKFQFLQAKDNSNFSKGRFRTIELQQMNNLNDNSTKYISSNKVSFQDIFTTKNYQKLSAKDQNTVENNVMNCTQNKNINLFFNICNNIRTTSRKDSANIFKGRFKRDITEMGNTVPIKLLSKIEHELWNTAGPVNSEMPIPLPTPSLQSNNNVFISNRKHIYDFLKSVSISTTTGDLLEKNTMANLNPSYMLSTTSEEKYLFKNEILIPTNDPEIQREVFETSSFFNQRHNTKNVNFQSKVSVGLNIGSEYIKENTYTITEETRDRIDSATNNYLKDFLFPEITTLNNLESSRRPINPYLDSKNNNNDDDFKNAKNDFEQATIDLEMKYIKSAVTADFAEESYSNTITHVRKEPKDSTTEELTERTSIVDIDVFPENILNDQISTTENTYKGSEVYFKDPLSSTVDNSLNNALDENVTDITRKTSTETRTSASNYNAVLNSSFEDEFFHRTIDQEMKNIESSLNTFLEDESYPYNMSQTYEVSHVSVTDPFFTVGPQSTTLASGTESNPMTDINGQLPFTENNYVKDSFSENVINTIIETEEIEKKSIIDENNNKNVHPYPHELVPFPAASQLGVSDQTLNSPVTTSFSFVLDKPNRKYITSTWPTENAITQREEISINVKDKTLSQYSTQRNSILSSLFNPYESTTFMERSTDPNHITSHDTNTMTDFNIYVKRNNEDINTAYKNENKDVYVTGVSSSENNLFVTTESNDLTRQKTSVHLVNVKESVTLKDNDSPINYINRSESGEDIYFPVITPPVSIELYNTEPNLPEFTHDFHIKSADAGYITDISDVSIKPASSYETLILREQTDKLHSMNTYSFSHVFKISSLTSDITSQKDNRKLFIAPSKTVLESMVITQHKIPIQNSEYKYFPSDYEMSNIPVNPWFSHTHNPGQLQTSELNTLPTITTSILGNWHFNDFSATPVLDNKHINDQSIYSSTALFHDEPSIIAFPKVSNEFETTVSATKEIYNKLDTNFNFDSNIKIYSRFDVDVIATPTYSQFEQLTVFDGSDINLILSSSFENGWSWLLKKNTEHFNIKSHELATLNLQSEIAASESIQEDLDLYIPISKSTTAVESRFNSHFTSKAKIITNEFDMSTFATTTYPETLNIEANLLPMDPTFTSSSFYSSDLRESYPSSHLREESKSNYLTYSYNEVPSLLEELKSTPVLSIIPSKLVTGFEIVDTLVLDTNMKSFQSSSTSSEQFPVNESQKGVNLFEHTIFQNPEAFSIIKATSSHLYPEYSTVSETYKLIKNETHVNHKTQELTHSINFKSSFSSQHYFTTTAYLIEVGNMTYIQDERDDDSNSSYVSSTSDLSFEENNNTLDSIESESDSVNLIRTEREVSPEDVQSSETDNSNDEIIRTERDLESFNERFPDVEGDTQIDSDSFENAITTSSGSLNKKEISNGEVEFGVKYVSESSGIDSNPELYFNKNQEVKGTNFGIPTEIQFGTGLGVDASIDLDDPKIDGNINTDLSNVNTDIDVNIETLNGNFDAQTKFNIANGTIGTDANIDSGNIGLKADAEIGIENQKFGGKININIGNENVDANAELDIANNNNNGIGDNINPNDYDKTQTVSIDSNIEMGIENTNNNANVDTANPNNFEITQTGSSEQEYSLPDMNDMDEKSVTTELFSDNKVITITNTITDEKDFSRSPINEQEMELSTPSQTSIFNSRNVDESVIGPSTSYSKIMLESTTSFSSMNLPKNPITTVSSESNQDTHTVNNEEDLKFTLPPNDPMSDSDAEEGTLGHRTTTSSSSGSESASAPERNPRDSQRISTTSQASTNTHQNTTATTEIPIIPFHFTIDADYDEVVGSRKQEFEESLTRQLGVAMRVPLECIQNLQVKKGSIEVDFDLSPNSDHGHLADEKAIKAAADELKRMIDNGQLNVNDLDGNTLVIVPIDPPTKPPPANSMEHTTLILGVVIGAFILTVIMVAITAIIVKRKSSGDHRLTPIEEARSKLPSYREIPFQEALFMKGNGQNKLALGKYCYQTGQWLGPGPEPMLFEAPESVVYRPPTDNEIRRTPRPTTAVRERLKHNWEVDWDSMVSSR